MKVGDFYLTEDVWLQPNEANAVIHFWSQQNAEDDPLAVALPGRCGQWLLGAPLEENGRGVIDWTNRGEKAP